MQGPRDAIQPVVKDLEAIQRRIGRAQLSILKLLDCGALGEMDLAVQRALIKLEGAQRGIGQVQVALIREMVGDEGDGEDGSTTDVLPALPCEPLEVRLAEPAEPAHPTDEVRTQGEPAEVPGAPGRDASATEAWLAERGIRLVRQRPPGGLAGGADRAALYLGEHYDELEPFYRQMKRSLSAQLGKRNYSKAGWTPETSRAVGQLGRMLHNSGMLSGFRASEHTTTRSCSCRSPKEE